MLDECRRLGITFVAFSPLARGFLAGLDDVEALEEKDIRRQMPRFVPKNCSPNLMLYRAYAGIAAEVGCTPAQLALAWLLAKDPHIIPIAGTTKLEHLQENAAVDHVELPEGIIKRLDILINQSTVVGKRYNAATQAEIDTEEFA